MVRPGLHCRQGRLGVERKGSVIFHIPMLQHAAVAVAGVLTQADVRHHQQFLPLLAAVIFDKANGGGGNPVQALAVAAGFIFVLGNTEHHHSADACLQHCVQQLRQPVYAVTVHPRHRGHFFFDSSAPLHKNGINQSPDFNLGFGHCIPQQRGFPQSSQSFHVFSSNANAAIFANSSAVASEATLG